MREDGTLEVRATQPISLPIPMISLRSQPLNWPSFMSTMNHPSYGATCNLIRKSNQNDRSIFLLCLALLLSRCAFLLVVSSSGFPLSVDVNSMIIGNIARVAPYYNCWNGAIGITSVPGTGELIAGCQDNTGTKIVQKLSGAITWSKIDSTVSGQLCQLLVNDILYDAQYGTTYIACSQAGFIAVNATSAWVLSTPNACLGADRLTLDAQRGMLYGICRDYNSAESCFLARWNVSTGIPVQMSAPTGMKCHYLASQILVTSAGNIYVSGQDYLNILNITSNSFRQVQPLTETGAICSVDKGIQELPNPVNPASEQFIISCNTAGPSGGTFLFNSTFKVGRRIDNSQCPYPSMMVFEANSSTIYLGCNAPTPSPIISITLASTSGYEPYLAPTLTSTVTLGLDNGLCGNNAVVGLHVNSTDNSFAFTCNSVLNSWVCDIGTQYAVTSTPPYGMCHPCDLGFAKSTKDRYACPGCTSGKYANVTGATVCTNCNPGYYAPQTNSSTCLSCGPGTQQPNAGSSACVSCPKGTASNGTAVINCPSCTSGKFAAATGELRCVDCPVGTFNIYNESTAASDCTGCPPGSFGDQPGLASCVPCPIGTFVNYAGSASCISCGPGTYQSTVGAFFCTACPAGKYGPAGGQTSLSDACLDCPALTPVSPSGSGSVLQCQPLPCADGNYTQIGRPLCGTSCPPGAWCQNGILTNCAVGNANPLPGQSNPALACIPCEVGTYTAFPGSATCTLCQPGYYQDSIGQVQCQACPVNTYQPNSGVKSAEGCLRCPASAPISLVASTSILQCVTGVCPPGNYSLPGGIACNELCPRGQYCIGGVKIACPAGTSNSLIGASSPLACIDCGPGTYASFPGSIVCARCSPGTYQSDSNALSCVPCGENTYGPKSGATLPTDCMSCPPNLPRAPAGSTSLVQCIAGVCEDGNYTAPGGAACSTQCPAGSYCTEGILTTCPAGTFNPSLGSLDSSACQPCTPGSANSFSGSPACQECASGTYQSQSGQSSCLPCAADHYQPDTGATSVAACLPCPLISPHSPVGSSSILQCISTQCAAGNWTAPGSTDSCQSVCPAGAYCSSGQLVACPAGTANGEIGGTSMADCQPCAAGRFSLNAGSSTCTACSAGTYSSGTGSIFCQSCSENTYNEKSGATSSTACQSCPSNAPFSPPASSSRLQCVSGTCSPGNYTSPDALSCQTVCEPGAYCTNGQLYLCPPGTFQPSKGATTIDQCQSCPIGSYAAFAGSASCSLCPRGFFGTISRVQSCFVCPVNTYNEVEGTQSSQSCLPCPSSSPLSPIGSSSRLQCVAPPCSDGYYRNDSSRAECESPCEIGYYCINGIRTLCVPGSFNNVTRSSSCYECGAGRYSNAVGGAVSESACIDCRVSTWSSAAISAYCVPCPPGLVTSQGGAKSPSACVADSRCTASGHQFFCPRGTIQPLALDTLLPTGVEMIQAVIAARAGVATGTGTNATKMAHDGRRHQVKAQPQQVHLQVHQPLPAHLSLQLQTITSSTPSFEVIPSRRADSLRQSSFPNDTLLADLYPDAIFSSVDSTSTDRTLGPNAALKQIADPSSRSITASTLFAILLVGLIIGYVPLFFYWSFPPRVARYFDQFKWAHTAPVGEPVLNRPTQLGAVFTWSFLCTAVVIACYIGSSANIDVTTTLVPASYLESAGTAQADLFITIRLHAGAGGLVGWCKDETDDMIAPGSVNGASTSLLTGFTGFSNSARLRTAPSGESCVIAVDCIGCRQSTSPLLNFTFPATVQLAEWELFLSSGIPADWDRRYSILTANSDLTLLDQIGALHFSVIESYFSDQRTHDRVPSAEYSGFEFDYLSYETIRSQPIDTFSDDSTVSLAFRLEKSSFILTTVISDRLSLWQQIAAVVTAIVSLYSLFRLLFKGAEFGMSSFRDSKCLSSSGSTGTKKDTVTQFKQLNSLPSADSSHPTAACRSVHLHVDTAASTGAGVGGVSVDGVEEETLAPPSVRCAYSPTEHLTLPTRVEFLGEGTGATAGTSSGALLLGSTAKSSGSSSFKTSTPDSSISTVDPTQARSNVKAIATLQHVRTACLECTSPSRSLLAWQNEAELETLTPRRLHARTGRVTQM